MKRSQVKTNVSGPSPLIVSEIKYSPQTWETLTDTLQSSKASLPIILTLFWLAGLVSQNESQMTISPKIAVPLIVISLSTEEFTSTANFQINRTIVGLILLNSIKNLKLRTYILDTGMILYLIAPHNKATVTAQSNTQ